MNWGEHPILSHDDPIIYVFFGQNPTGVNIGDASESWSYPMTYSHVSHEETGTHQSLTVWNHHGFSQFHIKFQWIKVD